ncbi:unnamed protein product [Mycena citricolor]|uniref:Uncharacterized protein n=1 Tax=Mycena citricolor TaxID=2018698 RepID=A0AAD2JVZ7_9AGAR|nr:unnamed protein product [Mycena citricolor]
MHAIFNPALGEIRKILVPPVSGLSLRFSATLEDCDEPVKIQLWSDIPIEGRSSGEWGEHDFVFSSSSRPHSALPVFSLDDCLNHDTTTLHSHLFIPLTPSQGDCSRTFSFTYRILHSSGRVEWLGGFGQNGSIRLELAEQLPVTLAAGWKFVKDRGHWENNERITSQPLEVARVCEPTDLSPFEFSYPSFFNTQGSPVLILTPRQSSKFLLFPVPTVLFAARSPARLCCDAQGVISASGTGSLLLLVCYSKEDAISAIRAVASHCSDPALSILPGPHPGFVTRMKNCSELVLIPALSPVSLVPFETSEFFAASGDCLGLFSPTLRVVRFVGRSETEVMLSSGCSAGHLLLLPGYQLGQPGWQIAFVTTVVKPPPSPPPMKSGTESFLALAFRPRPMSSIWSALRRHIQTLIARLWGLFFRNRTPEVQPIDERTPLLAERPALELHLDAGETRLVLHNRNPDSPLPRFAINGHELSVEAQKLRRGYFVAFETSGGNLEIFA